MSGNYERVLKWNFDGCGLDQFPSLNFFRNLYLVASTKKFIKKGQTKVKIIIAICESES